MHITLYGATGRTGSRILTEALQRGHTVTAIVRDLSTLTPSPNLIVKQGDLSTVDGIIPFLTGSDAVISAYAPPEGDPDQLVPVTDRLIAAVAQHGGPRFLVVGGAGSLFVAPGVTLINSGYLPAEWLGLAKAHDTVLQHLRASSIPWTSFSPAAYFDPGERTTKFRLGTDDLITGPDGQSRISMEDYAIATIDELEHPQHLKARFTIGY